MKILSFGSLNIDYVYRVPHFVAAGETLASSSLSVFSGGKGLNQSVALAKAGLNVHHAGAIGPDGDFLLEELRAAGANTANVLRRNDIRTGHAIIQNNSAGDNCILLFGGANRRITKEQIEQTLSGFSRGDALVIQNEISELPFLVQKAREAGLFIAMNPSPMEDFLVQLIPLVDLLILNEIEAAQITGERGEPEQLARVLQNRYPSLHIVLTAGGDGAVYLYGDTMVREPAKKVDVVDTTAAGDTFTGFFLSGFLMQGDPAWAMKFAATAAAIAVSRPGASPSIPGKEEVLERMNAEALSR